MSTKWRRGEEETLRRREEGGGGEGRSLSVERELVPGSGSMPVIIRLIPSSNTSHGVATTYVSLCVLFIINR